MLFGGAVRLLCVRRAGSNRLPAKKRLMWRKVSFLYILLCVLISRPAYAWEKRWNEAPAIEDSCVTYDDRYSEAPLFQVAAKSKNEKVYFFSRKTACPQGSSCPSRTKASLVDGDVVFGGPEDKNFRCVYYGTAKGKIIAGFVSTDNLVPFAEDQELTQDFLVGTWEKTK